MAKRVCPKPNCPEIIDSAQRYCARHTREYDARRGSPASRGYGADHRRLRLHHARQMSAGILYICPRCLEPIRPGDQWDLGHTDDRQGWSGPEHETCNRAAGGRNGAAMRA